MGAQFPPRIFDYSDYRLYLKDYFDWKRKATPGISLRTLSASINPKLGRSGLLSGVLKGTKNLGHSLRTDFCRALNLSLRESKYFDLLVQFNQAKDMAARGRLFAQLSRFRHTRAQMIFQGQYRFFTKWYYPVIWNYFGISHKVRNPSEIADALHPRLTAREVEEAISLLLELGLIKKTANGYQVTHEHFVTDSDFRGMEAMTHSEIYLDLATTALHTIAPEHRKFGTLVFSASKATFDLIREKIQVLHDELGDLIDKDAKPDGVYTFCYQAFPNMRVKE